MKNENILITGITGSGGSYLAECILEYFPQWNVHGICRWHSTSTENNIVNFKKEIKIYECDLLDLSSIIRTLSEIKPSKIFHLAAYANVRKCFDTPLSVVNNNIMSTANLLEAVRLIIPECKIQICSTSEVYGNPIYYPMDEKHPIQPVNPYAVSKLAQEALAYSYYKSWNLNIIITRMFAYINPKRHDLFASSFAQQIVNIEKGKFTSVKHGNLNSIRTLVDVRDAMLAYCIAIEKCKIGDCYNIGGQDTISVGDFLSLLKNNSTCVIKSELDDNLLRPVDITYQIPDASKFISETGWKPKFSLEDSVKFLLDYYRNIK